MKKMRVFGPVPSRRLGKSIGVNNIPPKICSYSCVYCQLGVSSTMSADRQVFYDPNDLVGEVSEKLASVEKNNASVDYLTLVPDGEPTLDRNLGRLIELLKPLGFKVAVITNSTLIGDPEVRRELGLADWVSVKIDTVDGKIWRKIDRPHKKIALDAMLDGIKAFSQEFNGVLATETMLVKGLNSDVDQVAEFIQGLRPSISYLSIPTRPPAVKWVEAPEEEKINAAYQTFRRCSLNTEYLIGYEGNAFAYTGDVKADLLSITAVHPMREDAVEEYLKKAEGSLAVVEDLVKENRLVVSEYNGKRFYLRRLTSSKVKA